MSYDDIDIISCIPLKLFDGRSVDVGREGSVDSLRDNGVTRIGLGDATI